MSPLTDNGTEDAAPAVSESSFVWHQWEAGDPEILLWDGSTVTPLTDNALIDVSPSMAGSMLVWEEWSGSNSRVMRWTGSSGVPLSEVGVVAWSPHTDGSGVVWSQGPSRILAPEGVYHWNGSTTQPLTDNASGDRNADISGNRVVWESAEGIQVWLGGETSLVAGSLGGQFPKLDGIDVVWQAFDGIDNEILLTKLCVACNDGVDNDGDEKIDYDGGFSALGYVAAEADPQCGDDPWKASEAPYFTACGLGTELALLLPALMWAWGRRRSRAS